MASLDTLYKRGAADVKVRKTFTVPLSSIYTEDGFNIRHSEITEESVSDLIEMYRLGRPLPNIVVEIQDDNRFKVIAGHRRTKALKSLYPADHRVTVEYIEADPIDTIKFMMGENHSGKTNLNAVDVSIACSKLQALGLTAAQIAIELGFSEPKVAYHLTIAKMNNDVKDAIVNGLIAADYAAELFRKGGDDAVLAVLAGSNGTKATRANSGGWRPSMGKSVVSLLSTAQVKLTDSTAIITLSVEDYQKVKAAMDALSA